jgi:hypothetical protein
MPTILIKISKGAEKWFAECEWLDIWATGETPRAAMHEFETLYRHFKEHYAALPDEKAGPLVQSLKRKYEEFEKP